MYLVMTSYFMKFEESMTHARNLLFESLLYGTLKFALLVSGYCKSRVSSEKLVELRKITEQMDQALYHQMKLLGARPA